MHRHVLFVDDEASLRRLVDRVLRGAGYEVTLAAHPAEALSAYFERPADVLVTDFDMPQMTGPELVEAIRGRAGHTAPTSVLVSGALDLVLPSQRHLFAALVPKPFRPAQLVEAVSLCMRVRPTRSSGTRLRAVREDDTGQYRTGG